MLKKRQSRRISSRKKHNIEKRIKTRAKKLSKLKKKELKGTIKLPKTVLLTDEELENLKKIKEEEQNRKNNIDNCNEEADYIFKRLVDDCDILLEVLDARDPLGSLNLTHEECIKEKGKSLLLCINNKDKVPLEIVEYWTTHLKGMGYEVVNNKIVGKIVERIVGKIGIFGQKGVGKMYLLKLLNSPMVSKNLVQTQPHQYDLLALLRNVIPLKSVYPKKVLKDFIESIGNTNTTNYRDTSYRDEFCLYFGIPYFNTLKELEMEFIKKFKIISGKGSTTVLNIILEEMHKGNIKFYRKGDEIIYEF